MDKFAYGLRLPDSQTYLVRRAGPERGEVVVLASPIDGEVLLKRVIAGPGDTVAVVDGVPVINGEPASVEEANGGLRETLGGHAHPLGLQYGGGPDLAGTRVPEDHYLVLGDNRGNSSDGRFFGWVARDAILGRVAAVCLRDGRPVWQGL